MTDFGNYAIFGQPPGANGWLALLGWSRDRLAQICANGCDLGGGGAFVLGSTGKVAHICASFLGWRRFIAFVFEFNP